MHAKHKARNQKQMQIIHTPPDPALHVKTLCDAMRLTWLLRARDRKRHHEGAADDVVSDPQLDATILVVRRGTAGLTRNTVFFKNSYILTRLATEPKMFAG